MSNGESNAKPQPTGRPFPWFCPRCRKRDVWEDTIPYRTQRVHEGQTLIVDVPNLTVPRCRNCGELVFNYPAEEQIRKALETRVAAAATNGVTALEKVETAQRDLARHEGSEAALFDRFRRFVSDSQQLLRKRLATPPLVQFRQFVGAAKPLLLQELPEQLVLLGSRLRPLADWLLPVELDLLRIARLTFAEDAYTELLAWSLAPETDPKSALQRQRQWLRSLSLREADSLSEAADPEVQVLTEDGRPDMLLQYLSFVVVVEAKTNSIEHETPASGLPQTIAYPTAVRHRLGLDEHIPVYMVFLTPDGRAAANHEAISTTYLNVAAALASALAHGQLPDDTRSLFKLWITHLATCAVPYGVDVRRFMTDLAPVMSMPARPDMEQTILETLADINAVLSLVPTRH